MCNRITNTLDLQENKLFLVQYNPKDGIHRNKLVNFLKNISTENFILSELNDVYDQLIIWFEKYINNNPIILKQYCHKHEKILIAEALFWLVQFNYEEKFKLMSMEEIRSFRPSQILNSNNKETSLNFLKFCSKLTAHTSDLERSRAIYLAATIINWKENELNQFKEHLEPNALHYLVHNKTTFS